MKGKLLARKKIVWSFFLIFFVLIRVHAESEKGLTFAAAARMAIEASLDLRNEYAARSLREGAWLWGVRGYLPKLSISASEDDRLSEISADSFLKNYSLNLEQLIWDGGRLSLSRKMEKAELDLTASKLTQMAAAIGEAAVSGYRDVLQGRTVLEIRERALESLEEQQRILRREAELGLVREVDIIDAEITVAMTGLEILNLSMDLEEAEWRLAEMLGLDKLPVLLEQIDTQRKTTLPSPALAQALAESRNRELAALRLSIAMRQAEVKAASLSWIPSLRLTGSFGLSGRQYPLSRYSWSVGLSIDFSSPWVSGNLGATAGKDSPYDRNARLQQTVTPAPEPGAVFSVRSAELALTVERSRYETAIKEIHIAAERGIKKCALLDKRRSLALDALKLEEEKYRLTELKLSLGEITRIDLMEARLDYAQREAAVVEAAAAVLRAERELELFLDLGPGELSTLPEVSI